MKSFSQFNIRSDKKEFEGDKIKMSKILNCEIVVHHFKIEDSKVFKEKGTGKCMYIQISFNNEKRIVFTGSSWLIDTLQQVPDDGFPFTSVIIQENERFKFT
jgi:hypothetical protein